VAVRLSVLGLVLTALLAGCSGGEQQATTTPASAGPSHPPTPPPPTTTLAVRRIVRAWSKALNAGDNDRAADLFARGARVIQGGLVLVLRNHRDAVRWNAALPCSGRIVGLNVDGRVATAEFVLGDRPSSPCDGPGQHAVAEFHIRDGKIVLWRQLPPRERSEPAI
jgi:hypothetical protein